MQSIHTDKSLKSYTKLGAIEVNGDARAKVEVQTPKRRKKIEVREEEEGERFGFHSNFVHS